MPTHSPPNANTHIRPIRCFAGTCSLWKIGKGKTAMTTSVKAFQPALAYQSGFNAMHPPWTCGSQNLWTGMQTRIELKNAQSVWIRINTSSVYVVMRKAFCGNIRLYWIRMEYFCACVSFAIGH